MQYCLIDFEILLEKNIFYRNMLQFINTLIGINNGRENHRTRETKNS